MLLRSFKWSIVLLLVILPASSGWRRRRRRRSPPPLPTADTTPPTFSNCPEHWTVRVLTTPVVVTWTEPTATDDRPTGFQRIDGCYGPPIPPYRPGCPQIPVYDVTPSRSGLPSGSTFSEGRHSITYTARDSAGQTATCVVSFTVVTIRCPSIGSASQRSVSCSNSNIANSRCTFSCTPAYRISGSSSITCSTSGTWSSSYPTCIIRTCTPPATPSHGSKSCPNYNYGSTCSFSCNNGYTRSGSASRVCQANDVWSGTTNSCRDTTPPTFSYCPSNIAVNNDDGTTSAVVSYPTPRASDSSGSTTTVAKRSGPNSGTSFSSGTHVIVFRATDASGNYADCSFSVTVNVIRCESVPSQTGRGANCPQGTVKGATCRFSCSVGYALSGPVSTTCNANGDWNSGFPNCNGVTCPQLSAPHGGSIGSCQRTFGSRCTYSCGTGYDLIGSATRQCSHRLGQSSGFWTESQPSCRIRTCPFPSVSGGLVDVSRSSCQVNSDNTVNYGGVCQYACRTGFHLTGNNLRTCGSSGSWNRGLPVCNAITCPLSDLPAPANGVRTRCTGTAANYGDTCVLSCNRGYSPTSPTERTCQDGGGGRGVWSAGTITCSIITCSPLSPPSHGRVTSCTRGGSSVTTTQRQAFDGECTVQCNTGYTLTSGSSSRQCLVSGQWDGEDAVCSDLTPPTLQCPDDVTVFADPLQTTAAPSYSWEPLRASDASGQYTAVISSVNGQTVSSRPPSLTEGSHTLVYTATDSSGNTDSCSFDINVQVVRCPVLESSPHSSTVDCSASSPSILGTVCHSRCDSGYEVASGDSQRTCSQSQSNPSQGYWSGTQLHCRAIQCTLPTVLHGSISDCSGGTATFQDVCQFICDAGYRTLAGNSARRRTCQANRSWSGVDFQCSVLVTCPALSPIARGQYSPAECNGGNALPFRTSCEVSCDPGYDPTSPLTLQCRAEGTWSDSRVPSCIDVQDPVFDVSCPVSQPEIADRGVLTWTGVIEAPSATDNSGPVTPQRVDGSAVSSTAYPEGLTSIEFEAEDPSGNVALCTVNLDVYVKRCPHMSQPEGGAVQPCTTHYGSTCTIVCNTGYQLTGSRSRTCELDGGGAPYWSGTDTVCTIRTCPVVTPPANALPSNCGGTPDNLATFGSACSFYCPHGYTPQGQSIVNCQADGTWSEASFECQAITCPVLEIDGVPVSPSECTTSPRYGQQCIFSCPQTGYSVHPIGSIQVTCTGSGRWSGDVAALQCRDNTEPEFISCPGALTFYTDPATHTAVTSWTVTAIDNDGAEPTIACNPTAGTALLPGNYVVTCTATDGSGNQERCVFDIEVKDRTCPSLYPPIFGAFVGTCDNTEGSICTVACNDGYRLVGSAVAVCETVNEETEWTREEVPSCEVVTCDPLESFDPRGRVEPFFCRSPNEPFEGSQCDVRCTDQYTLDKDPSDAPSTVECLASGLWSYDIQDTYTCSDKLAPAIYYCPPPIQATRDNLDAPVTIYFDQPLASDNSGEDVQAVLTPPLTSPHDFDEDTTIAVSFTDSSGNENDQCFIDITFLVDIPPVITRPCPASFEITTQEKRTTLEWTEPTFEDPGGKYVIVSSNYSPGAKFSVGEYIVRYTGTNEITGRQSECQFTITIKLERCAPLEAPANGILAYYDSDEGQVATLTCHSGYGRPPSLPQGTYICDSQGKWQPPKSVDCGSRSRPRRSTIPVSKQYSTDDCSNAGQAPAIAQAFLHQLLQTQFSDICAGQGGCSVDDIKVTCGPISSGGRRGRRSVRVARQVDESTGFAWTFEIDLGVDVDSSQDTSLEGAVQNANSSLHQYANQLENFLPEVVEFPEEVGGSVNEIPGSVEVEDVQLACGVGSVANSANTECVACVVGTYYSEADESCLECPVGSYQDEEGQLSCQTCPEGTSTDGTGAKNTDECYDLCPPGSSSPDGLFGCVKCNIGFYQPLEGQTSCIACPDGLRTPPYQGATDVSACAEPCPAGSYSRTGLAPCTPCEQRYYQPNGGQRYCLICDGRKTTLSEGSTSEDQCIELDHCSDVPCFNGADCISIIQGYVCKCAAGFEGRNCETNTDDCALQPCRNGGSCEDRVDGFWCLCPEGFSGPDCSYNINECEQGPCLNGGKCQDGVAGFLCYCPPGYEGDLCETERDPCDSGPCLAGGSCVREGLGYSCLCPSGFQGANCEIVIPACSQRPCVEGDCIDTEDGGFYCDCGPGFEGELCDMTIDFCLQLDCANGGTCVRTKEGASCICPFEFAGDTCDHPRTICDDERCENGATCTLVELPGQKNEYSCECLAGFTGRHCETNIDECASMPCSSQATCHDLVDGYNCECPAGFEGVRCEVETNECVPLPCAEGSTCIDEVAGYRCLCQPGKTGSECREEIDYCRNANCTNGATCINSPLGYTCSCLEGFSGISCQIDINECQPNPCLNQATCVDGIASFTCLCPLGFNGTTCGEEINECDYNECQNGARCVDLIGRYQCACVYGYEGELCDIVTDFCASDPCAEGSTCEPTVADYRCFCQDGFTGLQCEHEIDECAGAPCQHNATCVDGVAQYNCRCTSGFTGIHCEIELDECSSGPCTNGGSCIDMIDGYICQCLEGFSGVNCEENIDDCLGHECLNGGSCIDGVAEYSCVCSQDWTGEFCEDFIPCQGNPCLNGGECFELEGIRNCSCLRGFHGGLCEYNTDDCVNVNCLNGGECVDLVNDHYCQCPAGFSGDSCEINEDDCVEQPCQHGGTCIDGAGGYTCTCPEGYSGERCEDLVDPCLESPCQNGASCYSLLNVVICKCQPGYYGDHCEHETNECHSSPCLNSGYCIDLIDGYDCICLSAYIGDHCETKLPGNADLKFESSVSGDLLELEGIFDYYRLPHIKIGYWFMARGNVDNFTLFEYTPRDATQPEIVISNITELTVQIYGVTIFQLEGKRLNDTRWHNLVLTLIARERFEVAIDGVLLQNSSLPSSMVDFTLGGDVRIGFVGSGDDAEVLVSGVHVWSYDGGELFTPCEPVESGDILAWEEILYMAQYQQRGVLPGSLCQVFEDGPCLPEEATYCLNGATCFYSAVRRDIVCSCPGNTTGVQCQTVICEKVCEHGTLDSDNCLCVCEENYIGPLCSEFDSCQSQPCSGGSTCISEEDGFLCLCSQGFTGVLCDLVIDYCVDHTCQNDASCVSDTTGFRCVCGAGFTGEFCENTVVHGGWGDWSPWNECSKSCGGGIQSRTRECDDPPPSNGGDDCQGPRTQAYRCNTQNCPGRVRRAGVTAAVQINLPGLTCESVSDKVDIQYQIEEQVDGWKEDVPCLAEGWCEVSGVEMANCSPMPSYPKFIVESPPPPVATLFVVQTNPDHNITADDEGDNDSSLRESVDVIRQLVTTRGMNLGAHKLMMDNSTIAIDGWDICPPGTIESHKEGFCYPCLPGTYRTSDSEQGHFECDPCPLNSYQPDQSAEECIPCPDGLKTKQEGSTSVNDCLDGYSTLLQVGGWGHVLRFELVHGVLSLVGLLAFIFIVILTYRMLKTKASSKAVPVDT